MSTRQERLAAYVKAIESEPVIIGRNDCGPWVLGWVNAECGTAISYPEYRTRAEGYRALIERGGLVAFAAQAMAGARLFEAMDEPALGDVGVIRLSDRDAAVIFCGNDICIVRDENVGARYLKPNEIIKAWALNR